MDVGAEREIPRHSLCSAVCNSIVDVRIADHLSLEHVRRQAEDRNDAESFDRHNREFPRCTFGQTNEMVFAGDFGSHYFSTLRLLGVFI